MAFQASKTREIRSAPRVGRGSPIVPNAGLERWYDNQMQKVVSAMVAEYRAEIGKALEAPSVEKLFAAQDAAAASVLRGSLARLAKRWENVFSGLAAKLAPEFVRKAEEAATNATLFSLTVAGIKAPVAAYTSNVANTIQAATAFNHTLITNIQKDVHEKVFESVMLSLTSPNPEEQGLSGITNALNKIGTFSKDRTKLIARDQNAKMYASLSDERMRENGVEEFEWAHSSAGKVPRKSHVDKDGLTFKLDDPRLWTGPKSDQGPPGWAINCRCRKLPII